ncbi:MAG: PEP-CTERM system TPR-repeat protein PrsT [Pseudomonadales bacterium]
MSKRFVGLSVIVLSLLLSACDSTTAEQHLQRANDYFDSGELRTAVIELKNALQKQPDLGAARLLLGRTQFLLGDYPSALKEFERARDLGASDDRLQSEYLTSKNRLGRYQEVIGELEEAGALTPELAVVLGDAYLAGSDLAKAKPLYQQAAETVHGRLGLGTIAWAQGDFSTAGDQFAAAAQQAPGDRDVWLRKAEFELSQGLLDESIRSFQAALELPGGAISARLGLTRAYLAQGQLELAATEVDQVLRSSSGLFLAHYLDALIKYQRKDFNGAEAALREVQRTVPDHAPSLYLMGAVKFQQDQLNQAADTLQRYLAGDRGNESAGKLLAAVRMKQGNREAVYETLQPYLAGSRDPQILAMAGTASLQLGRTAQATELLQRAVELAPDAAVFRNQLALSLLSAGEDTRALGALESAIAVDGNQFQSDMLLAMLHMKEGNYAAAVQASRAIVEKNSTSPLGYNMEGAALLGEGDIDAARKAFERALEVDAAFLPAASNLARLDRSEGDLAGAIQRFESVLAANPEEVGALLGLADLVANEGRLKEAEEYLARVVAIRPDNVRAQMGLVRLQLAQNQLSRADVQLKSLLDLAPDNVDVLMLAAELALRKGDNQAALAATERLQTLAGTRGMGSASFLAGLGTLQSRTGQIALARRNLEAAMAAQPSDAQRVLLQLELARLDLREKQVARAQQRLSELSDAEAARPDVALLQADVLLAQGDQEGAYLGYETLAAAGVREGVMRVALLRQQQGRIDDALARLDDWIRSNPEDVGAKLLRADALMRQSDKAAAISQYEQLLSADNPIVLNNLAWLYMERGDKRALSAAQRATELAPDNPDILDTLGWVLVQSGDAKGALRHLRRSAQLNPDNATVRYHLAIAYLEGGDRAAAATELRQALQLGEFPEATEARARLAELSAS